MQCRRSYDLTCSDVYCLSGTNGGDYTTSACFVQLLPASKNDQTGFLVNMSTVDIYILVIYASV